MRYPAAKSCPRIDSTSNAKPGSSQRHINTKHPAAKALGIYHISPVCGSPRRSVPWTGSERKLETEAQAEKALSELGTMSAEATCDRLEALAAVGACPRRDAAQVDHA
eukprot:3509106-Rhodomonas_salina.2